MSREIDFPLAVPTLVGELVRLRAPTEGDIPAWYERATDSESAFLAGDKIPESIDAGFEWLRQHRDRFRQQAGIRWTIDLRDATPSVGSVGFAITSKEERIAQFGFVIGRAHWGRGIATAAGELVVRFALETMHLAELRAEVLESNIASRRVLEKLGFRMQHVIHDFDQAGGRAVDGCLYVRQAG